MASQKRMQVHVLTVHIRLIPTLPVESDKRAAPGRLWTTPSGTQGNA